MNQCLSCTFQKYFCNRQVVQDPTFGHILGSSRNAKNNIGIHPQTLINYVLPIINHSIVGGDNKIDHANSTETVPGKIPGKATDHNKTLMHYPRSQQITNPIIINVYIYIYILILSMNYYIIVIVLNQSIYQQPRNTLDIAPNYQEILESLPKP